MRLGLRMKRFVASLWERLSGREGIEAENR
jgi:hypothetical protein